MEAVVFLWTPNLSVHVNSSHMLKTTYSMQTLAFTLGLDRYGWIHTQRVRENHVYATPYHHPNPHR
jgi:hypothetical protein